MNLQNSLPFLLVKGFTYTYMQPSQLFHIKTIIFHLSVLRNYISCYRALFHLGITISTYMCVYVCIMRFVKFNVLYYKQYRDDEEEGNMKNLCFPSWVLERLPRYLIFSFGFRWARRLSDCFQCFQQYNGFKKFVKYW